VCARHLVLKVSRADVLILLIRAALPYLVEVSLAGQLGGDIAWDRKGQ